MEAKLMKAGRTPLAKRVTSQSPFGRRAGEAAMRQVMTTEEVACALGLSVRTIHHLVGQRLIPHRRLAGCRNVWFREEELSAWLDGAQLELDELPRGRRIVRAVWPAP